MRLITLEDLRDLYVKILQRGFSLVWSKITFDQLKRTRSAFNAPHIESSNWWIIPTVRQRWNQLITGDPEVDYETFISENIFKDYTSLKLVSIGSGVCSHELKLAELNPHWEITCTDIANHLLEKARETAKDKQLNNIRFLNENIYEFELEDNFYDVVFFHSSLHHFENIPEFIERKVKRKLKPHGKLIINEYTGPNRLQYGKEQLKAINACLKLIDKKYRSIFKTPLYKNHYAGSGLLRMIIADPSECVDSESIMPFIHQHFKTIIEKPLGGNILMSTLKDISHHFVTLDAHKKEILDAIIAFEDTYLKDHKSDFVFGVYEKC